MTGEVKTVVRAAVEELINSTFADTAIRRSEATHQGKIHFIPVKYRVLSGLLQSLNIKFGNFIEELIALVVENDPSVAALPESRTRPRLAMSQQSDQLIDGYITRRQLPDSADDCAAEFEELLAAILDLEHRIPEKQFITKDIDALFRAQDGRIVYLEIKYNDDHDTGKFVDINRKLLKTYAGLVNLLGIRDISELKPILYYFNPTKRWGPIYIPTTNIYRGRQLFDEFFATRYDDITNYLRNIGDDEAVLRLFDEAYHKVRYDA